MADEFLNLPHEEQRDIIVAAAGELNMLPAVAEKDVWVCFVLNILFSIPDRRPMVFKGGTSLSKVFQLIERFSEDIDISVNFLQDYEKPISKTKAKNLREDIERKLQEYKELVLLPALEEQAKPLNLKVESGDTPWEIHVSYKSVLTSEVDYIRPRVKIELSGRNETEPSRQSTIRPYLQEKTTSLVFPEAVNHQTGNRAIEDKELCLKVVDHKEAFWRDSKAKYDDCRNKKFKLIPTGGTLELLRDDYNSMLSAGMFFAKTPLNFEEMIAAIEEIEKRLNS